MQPEFLKQQLLNNLIMLSLSPCNALAELQQLLTVEERQLDNCICWATVNVKHKMHPRPLLIYVDHVVLPPFSAPSQNTDCNCIYYLFN